MVVFSAFMLSCTDAGRLKLKTESTCEIKYYGDSIKINIHDHKYILVYDSGNYVLKDTRVLAMSNKKHGKVYSKHGSTDIQKISPGKYSSCIYTNANVVVIFYNKDYVIDKIYTSGYVQYGEVVAVPSLIKLDSAISSRARTYIVR